MLLISLKKAKLEDLKWEDYGKVEMILQKYWSADDFLIITNKDLGSQ